MYIPYKTYIIGFWREAEMEKSLIDLWSWQLNQNDEKDFRGSAVFSAGLRKSCFITIRYFLRHLRQKSMCNNMIKYSIGSKTPWLFRAFWTLNVVSSVLQIHKYLWLLFIYRPILIILIKRNQNLWQMGFLCKIM